MSGVAPFCAEKSAVAPTRPEQWVVDISRHNEIDATQPLGIGAESVRSWPTPRRWCAEPPSPTTIAVGAGRQRCLQQRRDACRRRPARIAFGGWSKCSPHAWADLDVRRPAAPRVDDQHRAASRPPKRIARPRPRRACRADPQPEHRRTPARRPTAATSSRRRGQPPHANRRRSHRPLRWPTSTRRMSRARQAPDGALTPRSQDLHVHKPGAPQTGNQRFSSGSTFMSLASVP